MEIPKWAVEKLKREHERLDESFSRIWGILSPTPERDEVMWHIITAKTKLYKLIKEQEDNNNDNHSQES